MSKIFQYLYKRTENLVFGTLRVRYLDWYYDRFNTTKLYIQWIPLAVFVAGIFIHVVHTIRTRGKFEYAENGPDFSGLVSASSAYYLMNTNNKQKDIIRKLINDFSDFRVYEKPKRFDETNKEMSLLGLASVISLYFIGLLSFVLILLADCPHGSEDGCGVIMPIRLPFVDLKTMKGRVITLIIQTTGGFGTACDVVLIIWIENTLCELLGAYIYQLMDMLAEIKEMDSPTAKRQQFVRCVRYHHRIIDLADVLFTVAANILVIHVINSPIVMSMIAFQLLGYGFDIVFASHLTAWFMVILIGCVHGQRITNTSEQLTEAIYTSIPWGEDYKLSKEMNLMLLRSQRLFKLRGGSLIYIDHVLFVVVMKTAYSYLTLFNEI